MNEHVLPMMAYTAPYLLWSLVKGPSISSKPVIIFEMIYTLLVVSFMRIWLIVPVMCSVLSCFYLYDSIATRSVISISGHIFCNKAFIAVHYYLVQQLCLSILFFGMQFSCIGFDYSDICTAFEKWKVIHFSAVSCVSISLRCLPCLLCLHHTVLWIEVSHLFSCSHSFVHFYLFLSLDSSTLVHLHCCWWQS